MSLVRKQKIQKRLFDLIFAFSGLLFTLLPMLLLLILTSIDTKSFGIISQSRIGLFGRPFKLFKFKTMIDSKQSDAYITSANDPRITKLGRFLRKTKLDELLQLWNVLKGEMSLVGPRPDVPGYADQLEGEDRIILSVRPGITGPASIAFKNEEELLAQQNDPKAYNDHVIWPKKVEINKAYILNYSLKKDLYFILKTLF